MPHMSNFSWILMLILHFFLLIMFYVVQSPSSMQTLGQHGKMIKSSSLKW